MLRLLAPFLRKQRGALLLLTVILTSAGFVVSTSALTVAGTHLKSTNVFNLHGSTYYTAKAAMDATLADMLEGQDLLAQGYVGPRLVVNEIPVSVTVASPTGTFLPKLVYRYMDPGAKTGLTTLQPGNTWEVRLVGVQPFSILGAGWAFEETPLPTVELEIEDPTGAKVVTTFERAPSPAQLLTRAGTATEYKVRFKNIGTTPVVSKAFSSLGGDQNTWIISKTSGKEYVVDATTVPEFTLRAYIRQIPGPGQLGFVPQIIVVETWRAVGQ